MENNKVFCRPQKSWDAWCPLLRPYLPHPPDCLPKPYAPSASLPLVETLSCVLANTRYYPLFFFLNVADTSNILCGSRFTEARGFRGIGWRRVFSGVYWAAINQGMSWLGTNKLRRIIISLKISKFYQPLGWQSYTKNLRWCLYDYRCYILFVSSIFENPYFTR